MEVHQYHVSAGYHALCGDVHGVQYAVRRLVPGTDRVRGIDTDRHARQAFHHRHMGKVDKVAVWVTHVAFHAAQAEDHVAVAFAGEVFRRVQRFFQRNAKTPLEQYRETVLTSD